jgi:hypothetical protein
VPPRHTRRDFARELAILSEQLESEERWKMVYGLRDLETEWACAIAGARTTGVTLHTAMKNAAGALEAIRARDADVHLARAERWQAEIASWATSGAEGLVGMYEVRVLQLARAWLQLATASAAGRRRARELCGKVDRDGNGVPAGLRKPLALLKKALG